MGGGGVPPGTTASRPKGEARAPPGEVKKDRRFLGIPTKRGRFSPAPNAPSSPSGLHHPKGDPSKPSRGSATPCSGDDATIAPGTHGGGRSTIPPMVPGVVGKMKIPRAPRGETRSKRARRATTPRRPKDRRPVPRPAAGDHPRAPQENFSPRGDCFSRPRRGLRVFRGGPR